MAWPCWRQDTAVVQRTLTFPNLHTLISEDKGGTYTRGLTLPAQDSAQTTHALVSHGRRGISRRAQL